VQWSDFAYDNGFDASSKLDLLGPFEFERAAENTSLVDRLPALREAFSEALEPPKSR
jgi:hypothetical protein